MAQTKPLPYESEVQTVLRHKRGTPTIYTQIELCKVELPQVEMQ